MFITMVTDTLPYFLKLFSRDALLHSLFFAQSGSEIPMQNLKFDIFSRNAIQIYNYALSADDNFEVLTYTVAQDVFGKPNDTIRSFSFTTSESKYFESAGYYFNPSPDILIANFVDSTLKGRVNFSKNLGCFEVFEDSNSPAFVSIIKNSNSKYTILMSFYSNYEQPLNIMNKAIQAKKEYYYQKFGPPK
jgi:hypothetical protein